MNNAITIPRTVTWGVRVTPHEAELIRQANAVARARGYASHASTVARAAMLAWARKTIEEDEQDETR